MSSSNPSRSNPGGAVLDLSFSNPSRSTVDDKRLRKRLQNRANQRARRLRLQEQSGQKDSRRSFKVHRWRVDPDKTESSLGRPSSDDSADEEIPTGDNMFSKCMASRTFESIQMPPSLEQLLHLIHYNVFRGCYRNKLILGHKALAMFPDKDPIRFDISWPSYSRVVPVKPGIPEKLMPSQSQMDLIHTTWINVFPFPRMRDNLIRWEACFDHQEFVFDLMGVGPDPLLFVQRKYLPMEPDVETQMILKTEEDELTTGRTGMILWGEPYLLESWEVTPGFLRKWAWTMEGCEELIESTNKWRRIRGEDPIYFSVSSSQGQRVVSVD